MKEVIISREETQEYNSKISDTEEFIPEEGTFLEEDWVEPEPVITYKYADDPKFYREDELPENKGRLGNVIIKVPSSMTKEEALAEFGGLGLVGRVEQSLYPFLKTS